MDKSVATLKPELSVVIPALNEEKMIGETLRSLKQALAGVRAQVVVVDNGSSDATVDIAHKAGAHVVVAPGVAIGAARNRGAEEAQADVLLFLDADVTVTEAWSELLPDVTAKVAADPDLVTGSFCIPSGDSWIERCWFENIARRQKTAHLGSAHLIVARRAFRAVEGFDETLTTGEDFDLCQRLKRNGARIVNDQRLEVLHRGFPSTVTSFVKREIWHGAGDGQSLRTVLRSKVALAAIAFLGLHLIVVAAFLGGPLELAWVGVALVAGLLLAATQARYGQAELNAQVAAFFLFYFYFWARALAVLGRGKRSAR